MSARWLLFFLFWCSTSQATEHRLISLSPALTEIIFHLGFEEALVGVSEFSDYPEAAKTKTRVGAYTKPLYEKIIASKPTLVFVPLEGSKDSAERLDQLKIKYEVVRMRELNDIPRAMEQVAAALGKKQIGVTAAAKWKKQLADLSSQYSRSSRSKVVLIQLDIQPLIVAASKTFLNEIVELCGSKNVYSKREGYPKSLEALMNQKFDSVLAVNHATSAEDKERVIDFWKGLPAFKKTPVHFINPDIAARPGPRLIEGAKAVCKALEA